jgi:hypothetical protein
MQMRQEIRAHHLTRGQETRGHHLMFWTHSATGFSGFEGVILVPLPSSLFSNYKYYSLLPMGLSALQSPYWILCPINKKHYQRDTLSLYEPGRNGSPLVGCDVVK